MPSFNLFCALMTQWRVGMSGYTGLDYSAIPVVAKIQGIKKSKMQEIFHDIQIMENEALVTMRENQEDGDDC